MSTFTFVDYSEIAQSTAFTSTVAQLLEDRDGTFELVDRWLEHTGQIIDNRKVA